MKPDLHKRWQQLIDSENWSREVGSLIFSQLDALYSGADRFYHNWDHIADCLSTLDRLELLEDQHWLIEWALWFHDAIYDTHRKDNESASAKLAEQALASFGASAVVVSTVADLIVATDHQTVPKSASENLIVDIDLGILASQKERYLEYAQQIRNEYHWVAEKDYRAGRRMVLENFLNRSSIFRTDLFRKQELVARKNIEEEIKSLG